MNILNEIAEYAAYRVILDKREYSIEELIEKCGQAKAQYESEASTRERNAALASASGSKAQDSKAPKQSESRQPSGTAQGRGLMAFLKNTFAGSGEQASGGASRFRADTGAAGNVSELCFDEPDEHGLYRFGQALRKPGISVISEIKKASPSKGIISEDFPYLDIAGAYERAGADCISCLTEPKWFKGSDDIFAAVRAYTRLPMIRKDFVVDEYQLYQAKLLGADAVLLICALLDTETIARYLDICSKLRMDALVETHDEAEIEYALKAGAKIIGVNNRNLKDFSVDFTNAMKLREMIPETKVYVAESGVRSAEDAETIRRIGADAVLIGEALMRTEDRAGFIKAFKEGAAIG